MRLTYLPTSSKVGHRNKPLIPRGLSGNFPTWPTWPTTSVISPRKTNSPSSFFLYPFPVSFPTMSHAYLLSKKVGKVGKVGKDSTGSGFFEVPYLGPTCPTSEAS